MGCAKVTRKGNKNFKGCQCDPEPACEQSTPLKRPNIQAHRDNINNLPLLVFPPTTLPMPTPVPSPYFPNYDTTQISGVPYNVFSPGIYNNFCDALNGAEKMKQFTQSVDSKGNDAGKKRIKHRDLTGRTPTPKYQPGQAAIDPARATALTAFGLLLQAPVDKQPANKTSWPGKPHSIPDVGSTRIKSRRRDRRPCFQPYETASCAIIPHALSSTSLPWPPPRMRSKFCDGDKQLLNAALPLPKSYPNEDMNIYMKMAWRATGQDGCGEIKNADETIQNRISKDQCSAYFLRAVTNCNTDTRTEKYGGIYIASSPIGCIDFYIYGTA